MIKILDVDQHYIFYLFGIRLFSLKYKHENKFPEVKSSGVNESSRSPKIVVSLTSFPERIPTVIKCLSTVLNQTLKPDIVVLWLAVEQFPNKENDLPDELLCLKNYGLTIKWCENIRSYKKLIPSLKEYPDDIIITLDDDTCYAPDTIETLYNSYLRHPNDVHAHRCGRIKVKNNNICRIPTSYLFDKDYSEASFLNRLTGHAGVLYPPHVFPDAIFDGFMDILPTHDDVWFWAMLVLNGVKTRVVKGFSEPVHAIENSQQYGLCKINNKSSNTGISIDEAYSRIVENFPAIVEILKVE